MKAKFNAMKQNFLVFAQIWQNWILLLFSFIACLTPFFAFSSSNVISNEYLATMISEEAIYNRKEQVLNVNYVRLNNETSATRAELSNICLEAYSDTTYRFVNAQYNAVALFNENVGNYHRFPQLKNSKTSVILSNIFSNHQNPNDETIHDIFELSLMYESSNTDFRDFDNFCYIRQEDADYLITNSNGIFKSYEDLINTSLTCVLPNDIDGQSYSWKIANILLSDNDIYQHFNEVYGPWMLAYIFVPEYSGYSYSFDYAGSINNNVTYLNRHRNRFTDGNYSFQITEHNVIDKNQSYSNQIIELMTQKPLGYGFEIALVFAFFPFIIWVVLYLLFYKKVYSFKWWLFGGEFLFGFIIYEIFSITYLIHPMSVIYFSSYSIVCFLIIFVLLLSSTTLFSLLKEEKNGK